MRDCLLRLQNDGEYVSDGILISLLHNRQLDDQITELRFSISSNQDKTPDVSQSQLRDLESRLEGSKSASLPTNRRCK